MSLLDPLPWDANTPPAHINEMGIKWWPDADLTDHAHRANLNGTKLPHVSVWFVEHPDGERTRLILDGKVPVFESTRFEDIATHIDIMKVAVEHKVT